DTQDGVLISNVMKDSPAEKAGLKRNDVIVEFDGKPVSDMQKFRIRVADTDIGRRIPIVVLRGGRRVPLNIVLGERDPKTLAQLNRPEVQTAPTAAAVGGLTVREMTSE